MRLAAAVHETLSPFTTEMREGLAAVKTEIRDGLAAVKTEMRDGLAAVKTEMRDGLAAVKENMTSVHEQINSLTETVAKELEQNLLTNVTKELKKTADYILEHVYI